LLFFIEVTNDELTTNDIKSTECNEWIDVEALSSDLRQQFLHQDLALLNKYFNKDVKDLEMKSWGDQLPAGVPFGSWTYRSTCYFSSKKQNIIYIFFAHGSQSEHIMVGRKKL